MTARIGDLCIGICYHSDHDEPIPMAGSVASGSSDDFTDGIASARSTDIVISNCGHIGIIVGTSPTVNCNSLSAAKLGSSFVGDFTGTIVSGSSDTLIE